jgi:hypothetical protein
MASSGTIEDRPIITIRPKITHQTDQQLLNVVVIDIPAPHSGSSE